MAQRIILMLLAVLVDNVLKQPEPSAPQQALIEQPQPVKTVPEEKPKVPNKPLTSKQIVKAVCDYYGLTLDVLLSETKTKYVATARQVAMYLMRKMTKLSMQDIGSSLKRLDHSTILHGVNKITNLIQSTPEFAEEVEAIRTSILA